MLAGIGPVKPFLLKNLISRTARHAASPKMGRPRAAAALALRRRHHVGGEPGRTKETHSCVSAFSAEIVGGTLPEKRLS